MPEPHPDPHRIVPFTCAAEQPAAAKANTDQQPPARWPPSYAELHAKTNFSFLVGASHPDELVRRAAELNYAALAITDHHSLAGVVRAHVAAKEAGLPLLIGAEIAPHDGPVVVLLAQDRAGYGRLARLITVGRCRAPKGACHLSFDDVAAHAGGLLALVAPGNSVRGNMPEDAQGNGNRWWSVADDAELAGWVARYREVFADRTYLLAELLHGADDTQIATRLSAVAQRAAVPVVAAGDVHYHISQRRLLADVLTAIRLGRPVVQVGEHLFPHAQQTLVSRQKQSLRYAGRIEWLARTLEVAGRCRFSLDELRYEYPEELCPAGLSASEYLARLTWQGARERYPQGVPDKVQQLLEHELRLIAELRYEAYFLTVWDLVRFARQRQILCQGRGSAANSAVCYVLGVTSVDPQQIDVLFERFVSRERNEAPDIDLDFEHERREEVLQYLYEKYGRERAGMTAEVITYRPRSAVRDVGQALGLSPERVAALAKSLDSRQHEAHLPQRLRETGLDADSRLAGQLHALVETLQGFPRHLSQHVGGMVMTHGPLCELVPLENAAMPGRTVIQWDKDDLDALGILKVDCLALGMLTALHKGFTLLAHHTGRQYDLASIPAEDPAVYAMISQADTVGVFQIESRAQMSMLPRLRPRTFYDLVIEVAIVRPGPIQGQMVHPYLRRRRGIEPVEFPNEAVRQVLEKTLGVPIFQEQAMRLAVVAAGFTPGEADQLRRAMGAWRRAGVLEPFRQKLIHGMLAHGLSPEFAERLFLQIRGFGEYGFPESHAASFARLVYVSAWLKHYYPAAFTVALLNSQPMGFYAPAQLIRDAQQHGVVVHPPDVNESDWDSTLSTASGADLADVNPNPVETPPAVIRLGLRLISGLGEQAARRLVAARRPGPFRSWADLAQRTELPSHVLRRLAEADAGRSLGTDRRASLWETLSRGGPLPPLFRQWADDEITPSAEGGAAAFPTTAWPNEARSTHPNLDRQALAPLSLAENVAHDYRVTGLSLRAHPLSLVRTQLDAQRVLRAADLRTWPHRSRVRVAGLVLMRQRPGSARGVTFVTLEDETGQANLVVHARVWERHSAMARGAHVMLAHGRLERKQGVIHVVADRLENLSDTLREIAQKSRDFR